MVTTSQDRSEIAERPACAHCATLMWLAKVVDAAPAHEVRTFKCPVCDTVAVRDVTFARNRAG